RLAGGAPRPGERELTNVFAKRVFTIAGIYGLIVLLPLYFLERRLGEIQPPAITHPDFYYGFIGAAVAWQIVFLIIGRDPERHRPPLQDLLHGPVRLEHGRVGMRTGRRIRVRDRDQPERPSRLDARTIVGRRVDPLERVVQRVVGVRVAMRPAVHGNRDDVA